MLRQEGAATPFCTPDGWGPSYGLDGLQLASLSHFAHLYQNLALAALGLALKDSGLQFWELGLIFASVAQAVGGRKELLVVREIPRKFLEVACESWHSSKVERASQQVNPPEQRLSATPRTE